jgi:hypothetical protein
MKLFDFLLKIGDSKRLTVDAYWCTETIRLPTKIRTPSGGHVSIVSVCVDISYTISDEKIKVRSVCMSRKGGTLMGSKTRINIAASRTGEAWYATSVCTKSYLLDVVDRELAIHNSGLNRMIFGKFRAENRTKSLNQLVSALNSKAKPEEISRLVTACGGGQKLSFLYTKENLQAERRRVTLTGFSGNSIRATDEKDGMSKNFRTDRISAVKKI